MKRICPPKSLQTRFREAGSACLSSNSKKAQALPLGLQLAVLYNCAWRSAPFFGGLALVLKLRSDVTPANMLAQASQKDPLNSYAHSIIKIRISPHHRPSHHLTAAALPSRLGNGWPCASCNAAAFSHNLIIWRSSPRSPSKNSAKSEVQVH